MSLDHKTLKCKELFEPWYSESQQIYPLFLKSLCKGILHNPAYPCLLLWINIKATLLFKKYIYFTGYFRVCLIGDFLEQDGFIMPKVQRG